MGVMADHNSPYGEHYYIKFGVKNGLIICSARYDYGSCLSDSCIGFGYGSDLNGSNSQCSDVSHLDRCRFNVDNCGQYGVSGTSERLASEVRCSNDAAKFVRSDRSLRLCSIRSLSNIICRSHNPSKYDIPISFPQKNASIVVKSIFEASAIDDIIRVLSSYFVDDRGRCGLLYIDVASAISFSRTPIVRKAFGKHLFSFFAVCIDNNYDRICKEFGVARYNPKVVISYNNKTLYCIKEILDDVYSFIPGSRYGIV